MRRPRDLVQIGNNLDLVFILFENPGFHAVVVLGHSQAAVGVSGFVARCGNFTHIVDVFQDFLTPGRVVKGALFIAAFIIFS